ncbi:MAG TPA: PEGA domain-containing protein [Myxococcales bacterium]|jgi:hypothetical protein
MSHRRFAALARALSVLSTCTLLLSGGRAFAGDLPRVLVLPYAPVYDGLANASGEKAAEVLMNELRSSEQLQLVALKKDAVSAAPVRKAVNPGPAKDVAALTEAKERVAKADDFTKKLKFREAATELEKAITLMEGQHPYIDFADLVGANLSLAVAYFRLGLDSDGEKALANVVRLDPERKLDAEKYPPVFIRAFDNVNKRVKKAPRASLEVKPTSGGAPVILDGREVGRAPLLVKDVLKGSHFLRVGDGWSNRIEVPAADTVKVSPDLGSTGGPVPELVGLLARNVIDDLVLSRALALAEQAPADFVVLGGVHKEGDGVVVSSHLLKVASKKTCLLQRVVFDLEMLGAGIEIYKVGADITNKLDVFGDEEKLPAKVARDALPPAGRSTGIASVSASGGEHVAVATEPTGGNDRVIRKAGDKPEDKPKPADAPTVATTGGSTEVRKVTATSGEPEMIPLEPTGPGEDPAKPKRPAGGIGTTGVVLTVLAIVAVLAGGGVGGYFIYDAANKPITGRGTIQW